MINLRLLSASIAIALFGSSEWLNISAVWMQLPMLVERLPEKWTLPSILTLIVQLGCIAPLIYALCRRWIDHNTTRRIVASMMLFAIASMLLLAFLWSTTASINGTRHSIPLYILFFFLSCKSTGATVIFLPFMSRFKANLITPFFVGIGMGALVPSLVALIQGSGSSTCINVTNSDNTTSLYPKYEPPLFSVEAYFFLMAGWQCIALCGFIYITYFRGDVRAVDGTEVPAHDIDDERLPSKVTLDVCSSQITYLLVITAIIGALQNAILPSILTYAALPYGQMCYHLCLTLGNIANPAACLLPMVVNVRSMKYVTLIALCAITSSVYLLVLATLSPNPIMINNSSTPGSILAITSSIIALASLAYCREVIAHILNDTPDRRLGEKQLFYCGLATQSGSFVTACGMFILVNVIQLFTASSGC